MKVRRDCLKKDLVYIGRCTICNKEYCGETKQFFGNRVDQHHTQKTSAIRQHFEEEHPHSAISIAWSFLAKTAGYVNRKITEAVALKQNHYELNRKTEGNGVVNLY